MAIKLTSGEFKKGDARKQNMTDYKDTYSDCEDLLKKILYDLRRHKAKAERSQYSNGHHITELNRVRIKLKEARDIIDL